MNIRRRFERKNINDFLQKKKKRCKKCTRNFFFLFFFFSDLPFKAKFNLYFLKIVPRYPAVYFIFFFFLYNFYRTHSRIFIILCIFRYLSDFNGKLNMIGRIKLFFKKKCTYTKSYFVNK